MPVHAGRPIGLGSAGDRSHTVRLIRFQLIDIPRKEVIQPQLPLRLPCYDFVPVTSPTLGICLPEGLAQRLQVLPTSMT